MNHLPITREVTSDSVRQEIALAAGRAPHDG
jgi:hypothetical protein